MRSKQLARATEAQEWIRSLDQWPEKFGLDRMRAVLAELGNPQLAFPAVHVVGTNGKTTMTRTIEALLASEGLHVGAYTSPHVLRWSERIRVGGQEADFEAAVEQVRPVCEGLGATQFEALTAAALAAFAHAGVDVAVVEAGLGGRYDATNVLRSPVQVLTNVELEHTEVLGETREAIAAEKLAVAQPGATFVLPDLEFAELVPQARVVLGGAREAAEAFLGRAIPGHVEVFLPGRFERRGEEIWDGAHTVEAAEWLLERLPRRDYVLCVSILADKDVEGILERLGRAGSSLVATQSSNPRALTGPELAVRAQGLFEHVEAVPEPAQALERARRLAGGGRVLVTGSLYLLADLNADRAEAYHDEVW
jgi:dihydrofolate synthase / folylpolyglutamate synthase